MRTPYPPQRLPDPSQHRWRVGVIERTPLLPRPIERQYAVPHMESMHVLHWRMSDGSEMSELETPELVQMRAAIEATDSPVGLWRRCCMVVRRFALTIGC